jgi:hypothetical protein
MTLLECPRDLRKQKIFAAIFACGFLVTVGLISILDVWKSHFAGTGTRCAVYHFLRIVFVCYFTLISYGIGHRLLQFVDRHERFHPGTRDILDKTALGLAALTISGVILGLLRLLYFWPVFIGFVTLAFYSFRPVRAAFNNIIESGSCAIKQDYRANKNIIYIPLILFVALISLAQLAHIFALQGFNIDHITCDPASHYVPAYQFALDNHGLMPSQYFLQFYYSRGAGAQYLAMVLTDVQSFQLVSFAFFMLSVLSVYRLTRMCSPHSLLLPLSIVSVYLAVPALMESEYQKLHIPTGALMVYMLCFAVSWLGGEPWRERELVLVPAVICAAVVMLATPALAFLLPMLCAIAVLAVCMRSFREAFLFSSSLFAAMGVLAATLLINYLISGLFEFTPHQFWTRHRNDAILQHWLSPAYLDFYISFFGSAEGSYNSGRVIETVKGLTLSSLVSSHFFILPDYLYLAGLFGIAAATRRFRLAAFLILFIALVNATVHRTVAQQASTARFFWFHAAILMAFYGLLLISITQLIEHTRWRSWVCTALALTAVWVPLDSTYNHFKNTKTRLSDVAQLALGNTSYAHAYRGHTIGEQFGVPGPKPAVQLGLDIEAIVGPQQPVLQLNWFHYAMTVIPSSKFQNSFMFNFVKDADRVFYGAPESAAKILRDDYKIEYFLVDVNKELGFVSFAPLFKRGTFSRYFSAIAKLDDNTWLFSWKTPEGDGPSFSELETRLAARQQADQSHSLQFAATHYNYGRNYNMDIDERLSSSFSQGSLVAFNQIVEVPAPQILPALRAKTFDPANGPIIGTAEILPPQPPSPAVREVLARHIGARSISGKIDSAEPKWVYFHQHWNPHWSATVNGKPVPIHLANGKFMAIQVAPGKSEIVFQHKSKYEWLVWLFAFGVAAATVIYVMIVRRLLRPETSPVVVMEAATVA